MVMVYECIYSKVRVVEWSVYLPLPFSLRSRFSENCPRGDCCPLRAVLLIILLQYFESNMCPRLVQCVLRRDYWCILPLRKCWIGMRPPAVAGDVSRTFRGYIIQFWLMFVSPLLARASNMQGPPYPNVHANDYPYRALEPFSRKSCPPFRELW